MSCHIPTSKTTAVPAGTGAAEGAAATDQNRWLAEAVIPHEAQLRAFLHRQFPALRDTDDLVQETYVKILRAHGRGPIRSVKSYLFGIARNAACSFFRRQRATKEISVGDFGPFSVLKDDVDVVASVSARQELALVVEAMDRLPERCREVLVLWALEGLERDEIAVRLGISEHTVRAQLAKGMKRCIEFLRTQGVLDEYP